MKDIKGFTVSRELSIKLQKAGYPQDDSYFYHMEWKNSEWAKPKIAYDIMTKQEKDDLLIDVVVKKSATFYSAPITDELLDQLPDKRTSLSKYGRYLAIDSTDSNAQTREHPTKPCDALAELWLYIDEYKLCKLKKQGG